MGTMYEEPAAYGGDGALAAPPAFIGAMEQPQYAAVEGYGVADPGAVDPQQGGYDVGFAPRGPAVGGRGGGRRNDSEFVHGKLFLGRSWAAGGHAYAQCMHRQGHALLCQGKAAFTGSRIACRAPAS